nr:hypothetical protein [uncultured Duganella sp.]
MLKVRETIKVNGWTITLVASKCVLGGDWSIGARDIHSGSETRANWIPEERRASAVAAINAGRAWAQQTFG